MIWFKLACNQEGLKITSCIPIYLSALLKPKYATSHLNVRHVSFFWRRAFSELTSTIRLVIFLVTWLFWENFNEISFIYRSRRLFLPLDFLSLRFQFQHVISQSIVGKDDFEFIFGFLEEKVQRGKQYFDKMSQMRKPLFNHIAFPPVFFESKIDWMCLRDQIRPSQLPPSSSIFPPFSHLPPLFLHNIHFSLSNII